MNHLNMIAASLLFANGGTAQGPEPEATPELYRLTEVGGGLGMFVDQIVIFSLVPDGSGAPPVRLVAERLKRESNWCGSRTPAGRCMTTDSRTHDWIDSASCPAIRPALDALSDLPLPPFTKVGSDVTTVSDTSLLTIEGMPEQDRSTAQHISISEFTGAHRAWWAKTEQALGACWRHDAPKVDGRPVRARLGVGSAGA